MKKTVIKTICITLAAIIAACGLIYFLFAAISPKKLGDFFDGIDFHTLAVKNYERQYNKTDDIEDLYVLVTKLDAKAESEKSAKYLGEMTAKSDFSSFCASSTKPNKEIPTEEYLSGQYVIALVYEEEFTKAESFAQSYYEKYGYTDFNPYRMIVSEAKDLLTAEEKAALKNKLQNMAVASASEKEREKIEEDIASLS